MLETAKRLDRGRTAVQGEIGGHGVPFGPSLVAGAVRARHGLEDVELSAEASTLLIEPGAEAVESKERRVFAGRVGAKLGGRYLAVDGGLGGGTSAAGFFVAPDVGLITAYENCYVVPFASARLGVSVPVAARDVHTGEKGDPASENVFGRPTRTGLLTLGAGVKVPLGGEGPCLRPGLPPLSVIAGAQMTYVTDGGSDDGYLGAGLGIEARF